MPFELRFEKAIEIVDKDKYLNECCYGGDVVLAEIGKSGFLSDKVNEKVTQGQEDWGWYLWFWRDKAKFEVNICFDTEAKPGFRVHIIRQVKSGLFSRKMEDNKELETIKDEVQKRVEQWTGASCQAEPIELE